MDKFRMCDDGFLWFGAEQELCPGGDYVCLQDAREREIDVLRQLVDTRRERDLLLAIRAQFEACFDPEDRRSIISVNFDNVWAALDAHDEAMK